MRELVSLCVSALLISVTIPCSHCKDYDESEIKEKLTRHQEKLLQHVRRSRIAMWNYGTQGNNDTLTHEALDAVGDLAETKQVRELIFR